MATAKSHTESTVLSASSTIYYTRGDEGSGGPAGWQIKPSVDVAVTFTGTYLNDETVEILADETLYFTDVNGQITQISAQADSTNGTISIRPMGF